MGCASSSGARVQPESRRDRPYKVSDFHKEFFLLKKLGKGASASVYAVKRVGEAADDDRLDLAAKILDLRPKPGEQDADGLAGKISRHEFSKEIKLMRQVGRNEYCSFLVAAAIEEDFAYLIMERASCTMLHYLERKVPFTEVSCARIFNMMLQGLVHIHGRGVTHRDIKPDNYLFFGSTLRLCDFGLAEYCPDVDSLYMEGIYGTAPFMAPEMLARTPYGVKTDVWSMAVVCYVLFFGHFPYRPLERNSRSMKAAILAGVPKPRFSSGHLGSKPMVSEGAKDFVQSIMVRDPRLRPFAKEALNHQWLVEALAMTEEEEVKHPSLCSMLYASKREGAFDVRNETADREWTSLDKELSALQDEAHGDRCLFRRGGPSQAYHSSQRSTNTCGSRSRSVPKIESANTETGEWLDQGSKASMSSVKDRRPSGQTSASGASGSQGTFSAVVPSAELQVMPLAVVPSAELQAKSGQKVLPPLKQKSSKVHIDLA